MVFFTRKKIGAEVQLYLHGKDLKIGGYTSTSIKDM